MLEFDGDYLATNDEFRDLLQTVIKETFPTASFTLEIRQTKAMAYPKVSISLLDGPCPDVFLAALPILNQVGMGVVWAYRGKVMPALGSWTRTHKTSPMYAHARSIWNAMQQENWELKAYPDDWCSPPRERRGSCKVHGLRLSEKMNSLHPMCNSPTMAEMVPGTPRTIKEIAVGQRRDDLAKATPMRVDAGPIHRKGRL